MSKDKFLLVSLEEDKAKKLAQVLSSDTSRKILDHLAERSATETELSHALNLPISTVHYNLQQLIASNLVISEEFTYSAKGREVNHYKLANKYIIIAPKGSAWKESLKRLIPGVLVAAIGAGLVQFFTNRFYGVQQFTSVAVEKAADQSVVAAAAPMAVETGAKAADVLIQVSTPPPLGLMFFLGAMAVVITLSLREYFKSKTSS